MFKDELRSLRLQGNFAQARELIRSQPGFDGSAALQGLLYEHEDFWWAPIIGKRVTLQRRGPDDAPFVRACWGDADFMSKFNRMARPLPDDDARLRGILARERSGLLIEARALHWTIHQHAKAIGFVSATDCSRQHRRCEFSIGVLRQQPSLAPMEAAVLAIEFLNRRAAIERFAAYFYPENTYASGLAQRFGFQPEGVLKSYIRTSGGEPSDLLLAGLVLDGEESGGLRKLRNRIISRKFAKK